MRREQIRLLLSTFMEECDGVRNILLVSEGIFIEGILEEGISDLKLAALCSNISNACAKVAIAYRAGEYDTCIIHGLKGYIMIMHVSGLDLICEVDIEARMDTIFIEMRKTLMKCQRGVLLD